MITETVSNTNKPPIIPKTISCFEIILIAPNEPPKDKDPVSPIKIFAGGAFAPQKNPTRSDYRATKNRSFTNIWNVGYL